MENTLWSRRRVVAACVASLGATLVGCGGGGEGGGGVRFVKHDVVVSTTLVRAGSSIQVRAEVETKDVAPSDMRWIIEPITANAAAGGEPKIVDDQCSAKSVFGPAKDGFLGGGSCATTIEFPSAMVAGRWRLISQVSAGGDVSSRTVEIEVVPASNVLDVAVPTAPVLGYALRAVQLNAPLVRDPSKVYTNVRYKWSQSENDATKLNIMGSDDGASLSVLATEAGTYNFNVEVYGQVDGQPLQAKRSLVVIVEQYPAADTVTIKAPAAAAPGELVTLEATVDGGASSGYSYEYRWSVSGPQTVNVNNAISSQASFTAPAQSGVYTATLNVKRISPAGQVIETNHSAFVYVSANAIMLDVTVEPETAQVGELVKLTASVQGGTGAYTAYTWSADAAISLAQTSGPVTSFAAPAAGAYKVTVTATTTIGSGSVTQSRTVMVVVQAPPAPTPGP